MVRQAEVLEGGVQPGSDRDLASYAVFGDLAPDVQRLAHLALPVGIEVGEVAELARAAPGVEHQQCNCFVADAAPSLVRAPVAGRQRVEQFLDLFRGQRVACAHGTNPFSWASWRTRVMSSRSVSGVVSSHIAWVTVRRMASPAHRKVLGSQRTWPAAAMRRSGSPCSQG